MQEFAMENPGCTTFAVVVLGFIALVAFEMFSYAVQKCFFRFCDFLQDVGPPSVKQSVKPDGEDEEADDDDE